MKSIIKYGSFLNGFVILSLIILSYITWFSIFGNNFSDISVILVISLSFFARFISYGAPNSSNLYCYRTIYLMNISMVLLYFPMNIFWKIALCLIIAAEFIIDLRESFKKALPLWPFLLAFITINLSSYYNKDCFILFLDGKIFLALLIYLLVFYVKERKKCNYMDSVKNFCSPVNSWKLSVVFSAIIISIILSLITDFFSSIIGVFCIYSLISIFLAGMLFSKKDELLRLHYKKLAMIHIWFAILNPSVYIAIKFCLGLILIFDFMRDVIIGRGKFDSLLLLVLALSSVLPTYYISCYQTINASIYYVFIYHILIVFIRERKLFHNGNL